MAAGVYGLNGVNVHVLAVVVCPYNKENVITRYQLMAVHFVLVKGKGKWTKLFFIPFCWIICKNVCCFKISNL